jgi:hypothetical protein
VAKVGHHAGLADRRAFEREYYAHGSSGRAVRIDEFLSLTKVGATSSSIRVMRASIARP